jgi:hypothetical protein
MSPKRKLYALVAGCVLAGYLCYSLAISNSLEQRALSHKLKAENNLNRELPKNMALLQQKEKHLDSILTAMDMGNTSIQNNLLKGLQTRAVNFDLKLISFQEPLTYEEEGNTVVNYRFRLQGSYLNILKGLHALENKTRFGALTHVAFEKHPRNRKLLEAEIILRSVH